MANQGKRPLDGGEILPGLEFTTTEERNLVMPGEFSGRWGVVLFYRGDW